MCESRCAICKAELTTLPYSRDFVLYSDEKFYCIDCLIKRRTAPRTKSDKWSKTDAQSKIESLIEQTQDYLTFCSEKEQLNEYIDKKYAPSYVPSSFYNKLNSIFQGTYKGLKRPVPPLDLLEMLQQKEGYLDKVAASKWGADGPDPMSRINWDIAIVLSKYDSFLNWKLLPCNQNQGGVLWKKSSFRLWSAS